MYRSVNTNNYVLAVLSSIPRCVIVNTEVRLVLGWKLF